MNGLFHTSEYLILVVSSRAEITGCIPTSKKSVEEGACSLALLLLAPPEKLVKVDIQKVGAECVYG